MISLGTVPVKMTASSQSFVAHVYVMIQQITPLPHRASKSLSSLVALVLGSRFRLCARDPRLSSVQVNLNCPGVFFSSRVVQVFTYSTDACGRVGRPRLLLPRALFRPRKRVEPLKTKRNSPQVWTDPRERI
jgi:hypothetical protein